MRYISVIERNNYTGEGVGDRNQIRRPAYDLKNGSPMLQLYRKPELGGSVGAILGVHWEVLSSKA
jgi:hypothetical protein